MMRSFSLILILSIFLAASFVNGQRFWVQVWNDEFNLQTIDVGKWNFEIGNGNDGWNNKELQIYTRSKENAYTDSGKLYLVANKQDFGGTTTYTSARLSTQGKYSVKFGKWEISAKFPNAKGLWPAIWLVGHDVGTIGWPGCGEIVLAEHRGGDKNLYGSLHGPGFDVRAKFELPVGFQDDFHVYAINWQPEHIDFFFDGKEYKRFEKKDFPNKQWPFEHRPMYLNIGLPVGGNWAGNPSADVKFPQTFAVDWIRVSQAVW